MALGYQRRDCEDASRAGAARVIPTRLERPAYFFFGGKYFFSIDATTT
jgi:hypothetical protein